MEELFQSRGGFIPFVEVLLYPIVFVICAIAFAILILIKLMVLSIKFIGKKCLAACRSKEGPSFKDSFVDA
ncbi:hypothetical protein [Candidatus Chlamydia corallus]|uniref:hypothetical protein n=1 Tax=Candidatus Chlamydia corallus TaxID=2038470 RepID=UPI000C2FA2BC|nr:hypothetical protein [Candidatus Chlamydia corallus]